MSHSGNDACSDWLRKTTEIVIFPNLGMRTEGLKRTECRCRLIGEVNNLTRSRHGFRLNSSLLPPVERLCPLCSRSADSSWATQFHHLPYDCWSMYFIYIFHLRRFLFHAKHVVNKQLYISLCLTQTHTLYGCVYSLSLTFLLVLRLIHFRISNMQPPGNSY